MTASKKNDENSIEERFRWYIENVMKDRRETVKERMDDIEKIYPPEVMIKMRKFAEESFTLQSYNAVPTIVGNIPEKKEVNERTEWAISDVRKGVFNSSDYGVRGTYYSDLTMTAEEDGLYVSAGSDEYCFKFNKRFMIEDMITVLQKCLEKMDKKVKE